MKSVRARSSRLGRLTRRTEFDAVMKSGVRVRDDCFNVYALATTLPRARLGVTVARRVSAKAVRRNRIKRLIRESFRKCSQSLNGLSVVVMAQPSADIRDNIQLRTSLEKHWKQVTQVCKKSQPES